MQTMTKNGNVANLEKLTAENYLVPSGEEHLYHVIQEVKQYSPGTGTKLSRPRVQKYGKKGFESFIAKSLTKRRTTITVLHDPNEWIANKQQIAMQQLAQRKEATIAKEAAKMEQLRQSLLDELRAEMDSITQQKDEEIRILKSKLEDNTAKEQSNDTAINSRPERVYSDIEPEQIQVNKPEDVQEDVQEQQKKGRKPNR